MTKKLSLEKAPARPKLVAHNEDGEEVKVGDTVTSFRGEKATLHSLNRPGTPGRSGKVSVVWELGPDYDCGPGAEIPGSNEYYAGVFGLVVTEAPA